MPLKVFGTTRRYIDDYEIGCRSYSDAERALDVLQDVLKEFELSLNSSKTNIIQLPLPINPRWVSELAKFNFRKTKSGQASDLRSYFDKSIELLDEHPKDAVIKYALIRLLFVLNGIHEKNLGIVQSLLCQWAMAEPGVLPLTIASIHYCKRKHEECDLDPLAETLAQLIRIHRPSGHTSEIAWSIWGLTLFNISFDSDVIGDIGSIENSFIALLALYAQKRKLIPADVAFDLWRQLMKHDELSGPNWLLAYEALKKKWLPPTDGKDYIPADPGYSVLSKRGVRFFEEYRYSNYKAEKLYDALKPLPGGAASY